MIKTYTSLHNHTDYSNASLGFPDSINKLDEFIQSSYDLGLNGVAITNHEFISDHIQALKYYNSMNLKRPFKLILGNEIYLMSENEDANNKDNENDSYTPYYHFILNSLDNEGHKQLRIISSRAWYRAYTYKGYMRRPTYYKDLEDIIKPNQGHIIGSSACLGSYIDKEILDWKLNNNEQSKRNVENFINWCIDIFGENYFYLEIQPNNGNNKEQSIVNKTIWEISKYLNIKVIVTTDSHFMSKEQLFVHKVLLNSKDSGDIRETEEFYSTAYLMNGIELREYLLNDFSNEDIDEIFNNTNEILDKVKEYSFEHSPMIPQIPIDKIPIFEIKHKYKDYYKEFEDFKFYSNLENIQDSYFFYRIEQSLYNLVENKSKDVKTYIKRLNDEFHELKLISEAFNDSMASYYTTMSKIIELIWETDSLSMPGRGSACGFLVCYLLEITQIDPVPLGDYMPFWRHLSHERGIEIADIDNDSQNSKRNNIIDSLKDYFGHDKVLNVINFSTLSGKTAIEKAGKGLKKLGSSITDDTIGYLKSLVPTERGAIWSLKDCFEGNKEKGRKKVQELINEVSRYEYLKECMFAFESLIINRGIHASGILIGNEPYVNQISCVRSPTGVLCSCYDLHDSEYCGLTKVDILTIQASDKIKKTMDLLVENGHIEWKGSLKETYWEYLHPDVLEYSNKEMWELIKQIYSIFQFDTNTSVKALNQVNPYSVMDLSATNSLLRLMSQDGKEAPLDKYARYKNDINNWHKDVDEYGLNDEEKKCLIKYLSNSYMLADSQEKLMLLSMDERVSGFTLKESNKLRKAIAKKNPKVLEETKILFYDSCKKQETRDIFAKYIWEEVFAMSFGYSFSQLHSYSYSIIALQELNLNYFYPKVYWNTACLTVESQSDEENENNRNTNYGKIAKAIYKMKKFNVDIIHPNINKSNISFTPNEEDNTILFGIGGIAGVNIDIAKQIIENRPYNDFEDFYNKHSYKGSLITKSKFITLIKSGCFDKTDDCITAMKWLTVYENPKKESLTMANLDNAISLQITLPKKLTQAYKFKKYVLDKKYFYCNDSKFKSKKHYIVESEFALPFLEEHYISSLIEGKDYYYTEEGLIVIDKSLEKVLEPQFNQLKEILNSEQTLKEYNRKMLESEYIKMIKVEDINKWSFDSISFYANGKHELDGIDFDEYNISHFADLPEEPLFIEKSWGKRSWKQYDISRICGTVLARTDTRHMIDILTPDNEVVSIKFNAGQYSYYKQTIEDDESYFKRGNMLMISGYRRGEDEFITKKYKNSIFIHSVIKILKINENKTLELQLERIGENENECIKSV